MIPYENEAKTMAKHISCDYGWNPSACTCKNSKFLKSISVMDIVSTKMTNTIATNVIINSNDKKVRHKTNCYILHEVLLVIILLLIITIFWYHYAKHRSKQKGINTLTI